MCLQAESAAQNGPPPQILSIKWIGDEIMTTGPSHFKVRLTH